MLHQSQPPEGISVIGYLIQKQVRLSLEDPQDSCLLTGPRFRMNVMGHQVARERAVKRPTRIGMSAKGPIPVCRTSGRFPELSPRFDDERVVRVVALLLVELTCRIFSSFVALYRMSIILPNRGSTPILIPAAKAYNVPRYSVTDRSASWTCRDSTPLTNCFYRQANWWRFLLVHEAGSSQPGVIQITSFPSVIQLA
jgi:hypothetical protein